MKNCFCIPSYNQNILFVSVATDSVASIKFFLNSAELNVDKTMFNISKEEKFYYLNKLNDNKSATHSSKLWHEILGHCNDKDVLKLESAVDGMLFSDKSNHTCEVCIEGKMTQQRSRSPDEKATAKLLLVHCDLAGLVDPFTRDGFKYVLSFIDDYSGIIMPYLLKAKSDTLAATEKILADYAPFVRMLRLRSDNGTEFTSNSFKQLMIKNQIKHEFRAPYSPHQVRTI